MSRLNRAGRFKARTFEWTVSTTRNGVPQFEVQFAVTHELNGSDWIDITEEGMEIRAWYTLGKKDGTPIEAKIRNLMESYGWDGRSLQALNDGDWNGVVVQLTCGYENDQNGNRKPDPSVQWINPENSTGGAIKKAEPASLKALDAAWGAKLRAMNPAKPAAAKAPSAPPAGGPPKTPPKAGAGSLDAAWAACEVIWDKQAKDGRPLDQDAKNGDWFQLLAAVRPNIDQEKIDPAGWAAIIAAAPAKLAEFAKLPF